jgi:NTE family protein
VLAAGGSVGVAYHGAVLAALQEATGWDPQQADVMVGTSAGSLTAAMLRAGVPATDLANISEGSPLSPDGERLAALGRPHRPRPTPADALRFRPVGDPGAVVHALTHPCSMSVRALAIAALPAGGISTDAISGGIDAVFDGAWPDRPLWICSYDLRGGRRVVFGREGGPAASVGQAVAASCAIPMYFRPVQIGDRRYVDGGVHSMVNLDLVADEGLDLVIAVSPLSQAAAWGAISPSVLMRQPLRARLQAEVNALKRTGVPVVAIQPGRSITSAMGLNPMDAARRGVVSRATRAGVRRWLKDGVEGRHLVQILRSVAGTEDSDFAAAEGDDSTSGPGVATFRR